MRATRLHRRLVALLAMLAMVFGALAPAVAQAMVSSASPELAMEVCTSTGMLLVQADPGGGDGSQASPMQKPCLWCGMHGVAAPPALPAALPLLRCAQEMPVAFYRAGPTPTVWLGALTRAPPAARG
ncbi:DUF2946 domain-containing protein [Acidovorax sp. 210-6]|uniref:DUF2946 family protein n=1 Tax=Acidovorax sp. 210-6 TaxID=2699468 RepID=UPI00138A4003|nr:DUF2946 family protein [Acidovorax sp. 210-6]NCU67370.1 DUF2946 domain-containing protein [Acidovorax sp. 210-6]